MSTDRGPGSPVVLVVDDDDDLRSVIERVLAANGYTVVSAADAESATSLRERRPVDLVLTDVALGGSSGTVLDERMDPRAAPGPVLYMSGRLQADLEDEGVLPPGVAVLAKPFGPDGLLAAVRHALLSGS